MAYKNNLLEYYDGGAVPYRQGYQEGGDAKKEGKKVYKDDYKMEFYYDLITRKIQEDMGIEGLISNGDSTWNSLTPAQRETFGGKMYSQDALEAGLGNFSILDSMDVNTGQWYDRNINTGEATPAEGPSRAHPNYYKNPRHMSPKPKGYQEGGYKMPSWEDYKSGVGSASLMESAGEDPLSNIKLGLGVAGNIPGMAGIASDVASAGLSIGQGRFKEGLGSLASAVDPTGLLGGAQTGMSLWDRISGRQYGGEVKYMQAGGLASIARARKISAAQKDVRRRAEEIRKKQGKSGFWGTVGELGGKFIGSAFGPAGSAIGAGLGRGLGAKLGYGKEVGSGLNGSKWLAGSRREIGRAEEGIGKSFLEQGLAAGVKTGVIGAIESGAFKDLGEKFKTKLGTLRHGESPVAGVGESLQTSEYGKILAQDPNALTVDKFKAMRPKDPFEYAGQTSLVPNVEAISASAPKWPFDIEDMPLRRAGFDFPSFAPEAGHLSGFGLPEVEQASGYGGQYAGRFGLQSGGHVRDDMALIDMLYRR